MYAGPNIVLSSPAGSRKGHSAPNLFTPPACAGTVEGDAMDAEIGEFIAHLTHDRDRAPNTTERYFELLDRFATFARQTLGRPVISPSDIDRRTVELFIRHGGRESDAVAAASTRNVRLAALRGLFGYLAAQGRLARDPTVGILSVKVKSHSPGYLTEAEFARLRVVVESTASEHYAARDVAVLTVMLNCGLRISEALSLDISQVNFEALRFHGVMRKGRIRDDVVMNHAVADALRRWLLYRKAYQHAAEVSALFLSDRGTRLSARTVQRSFAGYVAAAGLKDRHLTPHSLRHSCATALVGKGVGIETVAEILNHRKLDTTRIYVRLSGRQKQDAVALLDSQPAPVQTPATVGERIACSSRLTARIICAESESQLADNGPSATNAEPHCP